MTSAMTFDCYSQRMLNPFRGSMNCIRHQSADAVTADGIHWDIYVSNDGLMEGLPRKGKTQVSDIRFGSWSPEQGLRRGPIYPSDDFLRMEQMGQRVYEHLLEVHEQVPFPFRDNCELWLLDRQLRPLVLLDSALRLEDLDCSQSLRWLPGQNCRHSYTSAAATALAIDSAQLGALTDYLAGYINACAGHAPVAQVFRRTANGSGTGLTGINLDEGLAARELPRTAFPGALLREQGHDAAHRQLIGDFICWQAPWQLLLPIVDRKRRGKLERYARVQPIKVARQFRLYPEIIDQAVIDAARVEARLRASQPLTQQPEKIMSTFYIELSPEYVD